MRRCKIFRVDRLHADHFLSFSFFFGLLAWFLSPCYGWREVEYIEELGLVFMCSVMSIFFFILRWEDRKWSRIVYITFCDEYIDDIKYECVHVSYFMWKW